MAGQVFADIHVANQRLKTWTQEVAGTRVHGTTQQAPLLMFKQYEKDALLPLPSEAFQLCETRLVTVHPDCHVAIDSSYYSVPYRYIGQNLEAYIYESVVALYHGEDLLVTHERCTARGQWKTRLEDYPSDKAAYLQRTPQLCSQLAAQVGPATSQVVETLLAERPLDRLRSVQALLRLEESVGRQRLEAACVRAIYFQDISYRRIKAILNAALDRDPLPSDPPAWMPAQRHLFSRSGHEFVQEDVA